MKKVFSLVFMVGVIGMLAFQVEAGKKEAPAKGSGKPEALLTEVMIAAATVDEVDYQKRTLTLKGSEGRVFTIKVDKSVNNFDQIKKGDQVKAEYLQELGVYVRKPDWPPAPIEVGNVAVTPRGRPPAVVVVDILQLPGTVEAVDHAKRTVTLKSPEGKLRTFVLDHNAKRFEKLKKGDEIVLVVTEAVAISVQKP